VVRRCPGILDNTDIVGNDYFEVYGVESENKCCEKCLSDMICNAWTFVSRVSTCYLKSVRGKPETRLDVHATSAIFHDREIGVSDKRQHQQPFDTSTSGKTNIYSDEIFNRVLKMYETYRQESESMYVSWRLTSKNEVLCMDDLGHRDDHKAIGLYPCHSHAVLGGSQSFLKSHENVFMAAGKGGKYRCLEAISNNVVFETCSSSSSSSSSEERFQFRYDSKHERIVHQKTGRCLGRTEHDLVLLSCDELVDQKWQRFELIQDKSNKQGQVANPNLVEYGFNKKRTIQIGASRVVPDKRPETCLDRDYYDEHITHHLPDTSIIICFVNEEFFALMRTISSALHASPRYLIREVILVDDGSDVPWLLEPLEQYLEKTYPKGFVKVIRNGKRLGLIKSRLVGASHAQGDVLTFLDSHVEATKGWLEPLLRSIQNNRKTAAVPVIPAVTWQNLEFGSVTSRSVGTFDWTLTFTWEPYKGPTLKPHEPLPCPVMAGGLFSIDRKYFYELGSYDEEMRIWGGENLEISFRLWTCGGNIIIHPCSIVYHIFRSKAGTVSKRQGKDTTGTLIRNNRRVLEVWMDDYKEIYYINNPKARRVEYGDVSKRLELRKKLGCESFDWYVSWYIFPNVYNVTSLFFLLLLLLSFFFPSNTHTHTHTHIHTYICIITTGT